MKSVTKQISNDHQVDVAWNFQAGSSKTNVIRSVQIRSQLIWRPVQCDGRTWPEWPDTRSTASNILKHDVFIIAVCSGFRAFSSFHLRASRLNILHFLFRLENVRLLASSLSPAAWALSYSNRLKGIHSLQPSFSVFLSVSLSVSIPKLELGHSPSKVIFAQVTPTWPE